MSNKRIEQELRGETDPRRDTRGRETYDPERLGDLVAVSLTIPREHRITINLLAEERDMDAKEVYARIIAKAVDEMYSPDKRERLIRDKWRQEQMLKARIRSDMASFAL